MIQSVKFLSCATGLKGLGVAAVLIMSPTLTSLAQEFDMGFRYNFKKRACLDSKGKKGMNPKYPGECADFSGIKLNKASFENQKMRGSDFSNARLMRANLRKVDLIDSNLSGAQMHSAILEGAKLSLCKMKNVKLDGALMFGAEIIKSDISSSSLFNVDLRGADLRKSDFRNTNLMGAKLSGANFEGADLRGTNLSKAVTASQDKDTSSFAPAKFKGALFNDKTKLPFSKRQAIKLGMKLSR